MAANPKLAIVIAALEDIKGRDITVIDTQRLTSMFDYMVIASADSGRQTRALAGSVHDRVKEQGWDVLGMEGQDTGEWVLVDLGDIVVHLMQPAVRSFYNLEELWDAADTLRARHAG
jgi:ribosome-associated protein